MVIAAPGPPHSVAHRNAQCVRDKSQFVSRRPYRHIENLAATQSSAACHLTAALIDNPDRWSNALFSCRASATVIVGFSCRQECHRNQDYQPTSPLRSSL
jgi:hypothetical protein